MDVLRLEYPTMERKDDAIAFIQEFYQYNSNINGVGGLDRYLDDYAGWLDKLERYRVQPVTEEHVPAETYFLIRTSDEKIVGMINIRYALNEKLRQGTGHIGYSIRPTERRKGYNKINLYLGLVKCLEHGIHEVLMDCADDNIGSKKTMEALGGHMIRTFYDEEDQENCLVFTIDTEESVFENYPKYKDNIVITIDNLKR